MQVVEDLGIVLLRAKVLLLENATGAA